LEVFLQTLDLENLENHYIMSDLDDDEGVKRSQSMVLSKQVKTVSEKQNQFGEDLGLILGEP
jgi:hypothetical protein